MSAFAVVIHQETGLDEDPRAFASLVGQAKGVGEDVTWLEERTCLAAKFDGTGARHRGVIRHAPTGSWLIAAGTVAVPPSQGDDPFEGLLVAFLERGPVALAACEGQFGLVIYDGRDGSVSIATDPLGYFGVWIGDGRGNTFVATAAIPIARTIGSPLDDLGVATFLRTGKVFGEQTLWRGVQRLTPGTVVTNKGADRTHQVYWSPRLDPALRRLDLDATVESVHALLPRALSQTLDGERGMWADLTGGWDTRLLTMYLALSGIDFEAEVVGPTGDMDVDIARAVATAMGWHLEQIELPGDWVAQSPSRVSLAMGHADGHLDVLATLRALWVHGREATRHGFLVNGMGGEMWRGPTWWPEGRSLGRSTTVHYGRQLWSVMHPIDETLFDPKEASHVRSGLERRFRAAGEADPGEPNNVKLDRLWLFRETAHAGAWLSLGAGVIRITTPLFSPTIVQHAMSIDPRWRQGNQVVRHLFERYAPPLAAIEIEGRGSAAPLRHRTAYMRIPDRIHRLRRAVDKVGQVALRRPPRLAQRRGGFDAVGWRRTMVGALRSQGVLEPRSMATGSIYRRDRLEALIAAADQPSFRGQPLLGRVATVELAARLADGWVSPP